MVFVRRINFQIVGVKELSRFSCRVHIDHICERGGV